MEEEEKTRKTVGDCTNETDEESDLSQNVRENERSNVVQRDGKFNADAWLNDHRRIPLKRRTKLFLIRTRTEFS